MACRSRLEFYSLDPACQNNWAIGHRWSQNVRPPWSHLALGSQHPRPDHDQVLEWFDLPASFWGNWLHPQSLFNSLHQEKGHINIGHIPRMGELDSSTDLHQSWAPPWHILGTVFGTDWAPRDIYPVMLGHHRCPMSGLRKSSRQNHGLGLGWLDQYKPNGCANHQFLDGC